MKWHSLKLLISSVFHVLVSVALRLFLCVEDRSHLKDLVVGSTRNLSRIRIWRTRPNKKPTYAHIIHSDISRHIIYHIKIYCLYIYIYTYYLRFHANIHSLLYHSEFSSHLSYHLFCLERCFQKKKTDFLFPSRPPEPSTDSKVVELLLSMILPHHLPLPKQKKNHGEAFICLALNVGTWLRQCWGRCFCLWFFGEGGWCGRIFR